jgi:hypothetical protein
MATKSEILKTLETATRVGSMSANELINDPAARESLRLELLAYLQGGSDDASRDEAQVTRLLRLAEDAVRATD